MRIRQLVIAAKERNQLASQICEVFDLEIAFYDPGIIHFGLENVLIPVGNTFIEIVSPIEENTTAESCLLYTSPSPRDRGCSRMPSSA